MTPFTQALLCVAIATSLSAQERQSTPRNSLKELRDQIHPGDLIRVHRTSTARYGNMPRMEEGRLSEISMDGSTLVMTIDEGAATLLESDVERVDVGSPYTKTFAVPGTLIGAAAGFGAIAGLIAASCEQPDCSGADYPVIYGAAIGAPLGALIGFGLGKSIKSPSTKWETVYDAKRRVQMGFFPIVGRHRTGAAVWLTF